MSQARECYDCALEQWPKFARAVCDWLSRVALSAHRTPPRQTKALKVLAKIAKTQLTQRTSTSQSDRRGLTRQQTRSIEPDTHTLSHSKSKQRSRRRKQKKQKKHSSKSDRRPRAGKRGTSAHGQTRSLSSGSQTGDRGAATESTDAGLPGATSKNFLPLQWCVRISKSVDVVAASPERLLPLFVQASAH